jgi:hypothetical protein
VWQHSGSTGENYLCRLRKVQILGSSTNYRKAVHELGFLFFYSQPSPDILDNWYLAPRFLLYASEGLPGATGP